MYRGLVIDLDTGVLLSYPERSVTVPLPGTKFTITRVPETVMPSLPDRYGLRLLHDLMGISVACKWFLFCNLLRIVGFSYL